VGYIVLASQLRALESITNNKEIDSISLLWLPGFIQVITWERGQHQTYRIDEDGEVIAKGT